MEYVVDACVRETEELFELAKSWFHQCRSNPFLALEIQRGYYFEIGVFDGNVMNIALDENAEETRIFVSEDNEGSVLLTLPQQHHWESDISVEKPPKWVRMAFNRFCGQGGLVLHCLPYWDGKFSLSEVAAFLNRPVAEVAKDVLEADANRLDTGQQVLALSVDMTAESPADWMVDIRGFLLGSLYTEYPREIYGGMVRR